MFRLAFLSAAMIVLSFVSDVASQTRIVTQADVKQKAKAREIKYLIGEPVTMYSDTHYSFQMETSGGTTYKWECKQPHVYETVARTNLGHKAGEVYKQSFVFDPKKFLGRHVLKFEYVNQTDGVPVYVYSVTVDVLNKP